MKRRDFIKTAALAGLGAGLAGCMPKQGNEGKGPYDMGRVGGNARMHLSFFPYELQLQHTFTVASYSRTTTPDVPVEIEYDG